MKTLEQSFIEEFGKELGTILYGKARPHFYNWLQQKLFYYSPTPNYKSAETDLLRKLLEELEEKKHQ